ncbi:glucose-6-phosphate isomerase [Tumebacillus sp. ITR2]|uniref:Glucose-6-phosphate isomerase n=1 Tax=Tumebacillus amylolyticus TaxID=2801339 RepID=A0ABS1JGW0_9BACL|nr:glucose-6-phosphate isomerase [Tumebacillus amylolyticus]MBL0389254.1 glucose-6-phosphate isomerase [Tumebacillus amylolyticus]
MSHFQLDTKAADKWLNEGEQTDWALEVKRAHETVHNGTGRGSDFLGWVEPLDVDGEIVQNVLAAAKRIRANSDVLLVIGIGGSYAGARAGIEMLTHAFRNQFAAERQGPEVYFIGHNLSATYITQLFQLIEGKDVSVNVISKSGTTTEPALAFRLVRDWMVNKYGVKAGERIYATTDEKKGALRTLSDSEGYTTFVIPDDVGGRYSVLTPVGLLPMAAAGIDIEAMLRGAHEAKEVYSNGNLAENSCYQYAAYRNDLYRKGKGIELLVSYDPRFITFAEWWKQLFGESEGKEHKGIYPASVQFTTDLHSMGQYIQEGPRHLFETVLWVDEAGHDELKVPHQEGDLDGLNYLTGKSVNFVNQQAMLGTLEAHQDGEVPNFVLHIPELTAHNVGHLFYFFEKACAISGYLLDVNPFDQPGVEAYKKNMFRLLGKPSK